MVRIPFVNTRIETDLMLTLALTPLWWFSGFSIFIYPLIVMIAFLKLLIICTQSSQALQIPKTAICFIVFLVFYLLSILINAGNLPVQRVFASLNNYLLLIMGLMIMVVVYHANSGIFLYRLGQSARYLCWLSGVLGVIFLVLWYQGHKDIQWIAWLGKKITVLLNYPYFYSLLMIKGTDFDLFSNIEVPRLALYSQAPTSTGGLMVLLIPLMFLYFSTAKKKSTLEFWVLTAFSVFTMGFSISRAAIYSFFGAFILVEIVARGKKMLFIFAGVVIALFSSGLVTQAMDWMLNVRKSSTVGRLEIYQEALRVLNQENLLMGVGARLREEFTMRAVGSHALYIEILFVTGLIGLSLFVLFQILVMKNWYDQRRILRTESQKQIWKFLGMSLLGTNTWLLTDTVFGLPVIAYGYFLVAGGIFLFGRSLREDLPGVTPVLAP